MMTRKWILCAAAAGMLAAGQAASAATVVVSHFGDQGWYSSDTRDASGNNLLGAQNTQPYWNAANGGPVSGDDAKIAQQIQFVNGPAGSLNDKGAVKLYATDQNAGKAHLSIANTAGGGFGFANILLDPSFTVDYRFYSEPVPTSRSLGVSISVSTGDPTSHYTLSYVSAVATDNAWSTNHADASSLWRIYGNGEFGAAPGSAAAMTLADWATDTTYGSTFGTIFQQGTDFSIYEVGFNLGSYQRNNNTYVDWFQSNLTNNGDLVDFQSPAAVPLPAALPAGLALLGGLSGLGVLKRRRA